MTGLYTIDLIRAPLLDRTEEAATIDGGLALRGRDRYGPVGLLQVLARAFVVRELVVEGDVCGYVLRLNRAQRGKVAGWDQYALFRRPADLMD